MHQEQSNTSNILRPSAHVVGIVIDKFAPSKNILKTDVTKKYVTTERVEAGNSSNLSRYQLKIQEQEILLEFKHLGHCPA